MKREPFPLQWPENAKRTAPAFRNRSRFGVRGQVSFANAHMQLRAELGRFGAVNSVITTDLPLRVDGVPYATGRMVDPGVAVWFVLPDTTGKPSEHVFACDVWLSIAENMTGIAKTIEALRGMDRWGVADAVTRAFAGFAALPPGNAEAPPPAPSGPVVRPWREVLGGTWPPPGVCSDADLLAIANARYRAGVSVAHPDRGGSTDAMAELNLAMETAKAELAP